MDISAPPPGRVVAYARALTGQLMAVPDGVLQAAYLHGSAALGGWVPGRSDVDLLFVAADGVSSAAVKRIGEVLGEGAGSCPGRELECSVVTVAQARQPAPPWPFELHVTARPGSPGRIVRPGRRSPGAPDLLMHYAVCRAAAGRAAPGPAAGWPPPRCDASGCCFVDD